MNRKTKITCITLYPEQVKYLNSLQSCGYNKSAVVRKAIELHQKANYSNEVDQEDGLNE